MARLPKKYRGKYYGKFTKLSEVEEFKREIIQRYTKTPDALKSVPKLVDDLQDKGYKITYNTVRTWLRVAEVRVVQNIPKIAEGKIATFLIAGEVDHMLKTFSDFVPRSEFIRQAINIILGFETPDLLIIFFREGNVILMEKEEKLLALTTQKLKPNDLKFLQGMVTMAEGQDDWRLFVKQYAKASGLTYYPL